MHAAPGVDCVPNVVVERSWPQPVALDDIMAHAAKGAWCLDAHGVTWVKTLFSADGKRMVCLFHAADAESVRIAQRQAHMPFDAVWACRGEARRDVTPATVAAVLA